MRRLLLPLSVLAASALPAAAANATVYCVGKPACAAQPGHATAATLKAAVDAAAAHPGQDAIELGAGTFPFPGTTPYVDDANDISTIAGMGEGATHLVEGPRTPALEVHDPGAVVQDLTIDAVAGSTASALVLDGGPGTTARRVTVTGGPASAGVAFAVDGGGLLDHVTASAPQRTGGMTAAYVFGAGGATISDSSFTASYGIRVNDADTTRLRNVRTDALWRPVQIDQGTIDVDGLLASAPATASEELVSVATGAIASLTLRHATLVMHAGMNGVAANAYAAGAKASVVARDVVVTGGGGYAFTRLTSNGGAASVNVAYSAYAPTRTYNIPGLPGPTDLALPDDPRFGADHALLAGSPLIDRGELTLPAGGAATDLAGGARVVGGRTDIGAYEYTPPATTAPVADPVAAPATTAPPAPAPAAAPLPVAAAGTPLPARLVLFAGARQKLDKRGRFTVAATCDAPLGCKGTLRLTARSGRRTVTLGSVKVALRNGAARTFHITLNRSARRLLARRGRLSVAVSAAVRDGGGARLPARTAFSGRRR
jgi:hypothetical protein